MAIKSFTVGEVLTASDTNTYLANSGLVLVKQQTIGSGVSTQNITSCFNSTYDNYVVSISNMTASVSGGVVYIKLLVGTTATTSGFYATTQYFSTAGTTPAYAAVTNSAQTEVGSIDNTSKNSSVFTLEQPNLANYTRLTWSSIDDNYWRFGAAVHQANTSYDGLQILPSSGTLTGGTITVYGYRLG